MRDLSIPAILILVVILVGCTTAAQASLVTLLPSDAQGRIALVESGWESNSSWTLTPLECSEARPFCTWTWWDELSELSLQLSHDGERAPLGLESSIDSFGVFSKQSDLREMLAELHRDGLPMEQVAQPVCIGLPEPASIAIWSLLGLGGAGLHVWRRRKGRFESLVGSPRPAWSEENRAAIHALVDRFCGKP